MRVGLCFALLVGVAGCGKVEPPRSAPAEPSKSRSERLPPKASPKAVDAQKEGNTRIGSFRKAKKLLLSEVVHDRRETFYCGCDFDKDKQVDLESCGYKVRRDASRAQKMEVEHVVPAEAFGRSFEAWREGHPECVHKKGKKKGKRYKGRRCAKQTSALFRRMEADLYNLQPSIGEVNGDRSNYSMEEIPGEAREYGECDVEIEGRKIEPKESIRGDIARIYFYMDRAYPGRGIVGKKRRRILQAWDKADPIDAWERKRAKRIHALQGNANPFVQ